MSLNPFDVLCEKLESIETLLERITSEKPKGQRNTSFVSIDKFCNEFGFMKLSTAYIRLSKNGPGIPGATKIGRLWFIDLDVFEKEVRDSGGLKSLELA